MHRTKKTPHWSDQGIARAGGDSRAAGRVRAMWPVFVAHHIFSDMPFYGAKLATPYIKEHLGPYYKSSMDAKVPLTSLAVVGGFSVELLHCADNHDKLRRMQYLAALSTWRRPPRAR
eukprot:7275899-Prymnesium_polylepis.1